MLVKKQVRSLCKHFLFYEEIAQMSSNETEVDSLF